MRQGSAFINDLRAASLEVYNVKCLLLLPVYLNFCHSIFSFSLFHCFINLQRDYSESKFIHL